MGGAALNLVAAINGHEWCGGPAEKRKDDVNARRAERRVGLCVSEQQTALKKVKRRRKIPGYSRTQRQSIP